MKQTVRSFFCIIGLLVLWLCVVVAICTSDSQPESYYTPDHVESYTVGSFDQLQICKIYYLTLEDTPALIPTDDFEEYGHWFSLLELTKERCGTEVIYTAVFRETKPPT